MKKHASLIIADSEPREFVARPFERLRCMLGGHKRNVFTGRETQYEGRELSCRCGKYCGGIDWM